MNFLRDLWSARELLGNLVLRETRGQYKRTMLGRLWSLMNPLASMLIYTFIFAFVFRIQPEAGDPSGLNVFPIWLMCGLLPWAFFAGSLNAAANSLLTNMALVQKVYFPRAVLPIAAIGTLGTNWLLEMAVLLAALTIVGSTALLWTPVLVLLMLLLALFAVGLGLTLAIVTIYFRDTQHLLMIITQLWMYLTPIIYPASLMRDLSDKVGGIWNSSVTLMDLYAINPMYHFTAAFREVLYDNRWPDPSHVLTCAAWTAGALLLGGFLFSKHEKKIAEML